MGWQNKLRSSELFLVIFFLQVEIGPKMFRLDFAHAQMFMTKMLSFKQF